MGYKGAVSGLCALRHLIQVAAAAAAVAATISLPFHLHVAEASILSNLRPLRGTLQNLGGPDQLLKVALAEDVEVFDNFVDDVVVGAAGAAGTSGVRQDHIPVPQDYETALMAGVMMARVLLQVETEMGSGPLLSRGDAPKDSLGLLHFAFRKAQREAKRLSACRGRLLLEASKYYLTRFNISLARAQTSLEDLNTQMDSDTCRKVVIPECEESTTTKREAVEGREGAEYHSAQIVLHCDPSAAFRTADGTCNNLLNPSWGAARTPFVRYLAPAYEDGVDVMRGEGRGGLHRLPSPRAVSLGMHVAGEGEGQAVTLTPSMMLMQWGQFLDHDLVHTPEAAAVRGDGEPVPLPCCDTGVHEDDNQEAGHDCQPIDVSGDPLATSQARTCMRFVRSLVASRGCLMGPREQMNQVTSYLDGSAIYGSSPVAARDLRELRGGRLISSAPPQAHVDPTTPKDERRPFLPTAPCEHIDESVCYKAGDERVNEQPALTSMHTLWLRVHQGTATRLSALNPHWDDERLYQETRRVVVALLQQTTFREFLPVILGKSQMLQNHLLPTLGYERSYNPSVDASIANAFATAAFRFGHTLVKDFLHGSKGRVVPLTTSFMDPHVLREPETGPSDLLGGVASTDADPVDAYLVPSLSHLLFAQHGDHLGLDLMALNIQRGRDHGLPPYAVWRRACGLPMPTTFTDLGALMPARYVNQFSTAYQSVMDVDLFPAGLAEHPSPGGILGPTFSCLLTQQFSSLKQGDRFWYQSPDQPYPFTLDQLESLGKVTLAGVMCGHLRLSQLQPNVFFAPALPDNPLLPCSQYQQLDFSAWKEVIPTPAPTTPSPSPSPTPAPSTPYPSSTPMPVPAPDPSPMECVGAGLWAGLPGLDKWCVQNCFHVPSFCPPSHCDCRPRQHPQQLQHLQHYPPYDHHHHHNPHF